jgi:hypothetical protein
LYFCSSADKDTALNESIGIGIEKHCNNGWLDPDPDSDFDADELNLLGIGVNQSGGKNHTSPGYGCLLSGGRGP